MYQQGTAALKNKTTKQKTRKYVTGIEDNAGPISLRRDGHGGAVHPQLHRRQVVSHFRQAVPPVLGVAQPQLPVRVFSPALEKMAGLAS